MIKKIIGFFKWVGSIFKKVKPIYADVDTVAFVSTTMIDGQMYRVTTYKSGKVKKERIDATDPTGIGDFLDDIDD